MQSGELNRSSFYFDRHQTFTYGKTMGGACATELEQGGFLAYTVASSNLVGVSTSIDLLDALQQRCCENYVILRFIVVSEQLDHCVLY